MKDVKEMPILSFDNDKFWKEAGEKGGEGYNGAICLSLILFNDLENRVSYVDTFVLPKALFTGIEIIQDESFSICRFIVSLDYDHVYIITQNQNIVKAPLKEIKELQGIGNARGLEWSSMSCRPFSEDELDRMKNNYQVE
jgi:hypothetical protein